MSRRTDHATASRADAHRRRRRLLWRYPAAQRPRLAAIAAFTLVSSLSSAWQPLPFKLLIDNAVGGAPITGFPSALLHRVGLGDPSPRAVVVIAVLAAFASTLLLSAINALLFWQWEYLGQGLVRDVMRDMHAKVQRLSPAYHLRFDTGDTMSRVQWDSHGVYTLMSAILVDPVVGVVTVATVGVSAWGQSARMTVVIFAFAPLLAAASVAFGARLQARAKALREAESATVSFVTQVMHSMPVVQAFAAEDRNLATFAGLSDAAVNSTRREALTSAVAASFGQFLSAASAAMVLVLGGREVVHERMSIGSLLVFIIYAQTLQANAERLMGVYRAARSAQGSVDRILDVLDSDDELPQRAQPLRPARWRATAEIRFEAVTAGYEPGRPVLHSVDLLIGAGQTVAFVGATGAGKTTLLSLVSRQLDPWSGRVTIDGVDVRDLALDELRRHVAIVRQEPILLPGTVAENIAFGLPQATSGEIREAADDAYATEFIEQLPQGFDTEIGETSRLLSGGQRQRLAIARALARHAPVLILDEPTSALDARAEAAIVGLLERLRGQSGKPPPFLATRSQPTVLVIAHRLSTIRASSRIVVLDGGRIVEDGTHDELVAAGGTYAAMYALQSKDVPQ